MLICIQGCGQQIAHLPVVQESCQAGGRLSSFYWLGAEGGLAEVSSDCTHKASMVSSLLYSSADERRWCP